MTDKDNYELCAYRFVRPQSQFAYFRSTNVSCDQIDRQIERERAVVFITRYG